MKRLLYAILAVTLVFGYCLVLHADPPRSGRKPAGDARTKAAAVQTDEQVYAQLAGAWSCFYGGRYEDAVKQSASLLKLTDKRLHWVTVEAAHVQARCCWAAGKASGQAKARKMWKKLEKTSTTNATKTRQKIIEALELEADDDSARLNQATGILEQVLKDNSVSLALPEAALDLARLYIKANRLDDAEKTLNFVKEWLSNKDVLTKLELPNACLARPYMDAANAALEQLKYLRDAGRKEFEAAERLRVAQKWQESIKAYKDVTKDFPTTDYAPRSELATGHCLVGLKKMGQAAAHWKKFIESASAGPWRGQAFVALIDICLEEQLDLAEAGKYAALAGSSMPTALADEKAAVSWKDVEFDVHLRIAMVNFCQGKGDVAAESFESAKKLTGNINILESLDALIAAARTGKPIIPQDAQGGGAGEIKAAGSASPSGKAAVALSLGVIHMVAERPNKADVFFDRVLGTPASGSQPARAGITGATKAQLAFATFCRGVVFQMRVMRKEAREQLEASIKMCSEGSWHDETLYRLATIIQADAQTRYGKPADPNADMKDPKVEKAEKERLANLLKARGESLPYWLELIKRYPKSPRCEQAYYNAGVLMCELAEVADGKDSEKLWKEAAAALGKLCENYPEGPCTGEALLILGQYFLERQVDLKDSLDYLTKLDAWISQARKTDEVHPMSLSVIIAPPQPCVAPQPLERERGNDNHAYRLSGGRVVISRPQYSAEELFKCCLSKWYLDSTELQCTKLLGFIYFASGQKDKALDHYARIMKLDSSAKGTEAGGDWSDYSRLKWGVDHGYLFAYPEELNLYDARQHTAVLLADFYYVTQRFDAAADMAQRLMKSDFGRLKGHASEYPQYLYATCLYWTQGREKAFEEYLKVFDKGNDVLDPKAMSFTQERAAYAAGHIAMGMQDGPQRKQGKDILYKLAFSGKDSQYAYQSRIAYAVALIEEGNREEGLRILESFPESAGSWRKIALTYAKAYRKAEQNSKKH